MSDTKPKLVHYEKKPRPKKLPWLNVNIHGPPDAGETVLLSYLVNNGEEWVRSYCFAKYLPKIKQYVMEDGTLLYEDDYNVQYWLPIIPPT